MQSSETLEVLETGLGLTLQDQGRIGWRRFGVPVGGCMDDHAAGWANRLLDNSPRAAVVEALLQGAQLAALEDVWIAITGADARCNLPTWRAVRLTKGTVVQFPWSQSGVWIYIAVEGGFLGSKWLGSSSVYSPGGFSRPICMGDRLHRSGGPRLQLAPGVAGRSAPHAEKRDHNLPPVLRVWPGPQWQQFSERQRAAFFDHEWTITPQSDRAGYRLSGKSIEPVRLQMFSEPVRVGTVQVPENGSPIVIMRDGPTVGGYPKIGVVDPADLSWLAQCRPGQKVRFQLYSSAPLKDRDAT